MLLVHPLSALQEVFWCIELIDTGYGAKREAVKLKLTLELENYQQACVCIVRTLLKYEVYITNLYNVFII
jgi:hypothetical protein